MSEYTITEDLFVRVNTYALRKRRAMLIGVALCVPLAALAVLGTAPTVLVAVVIVYGFLLVFFTLIAPVINRWHYRRIYRKNPLLHRRQSFAITDDGLRLWSDNGESRYAFTDLQKVRVYPDMVLIYPTTTIYHVIPRTVLSDRDLARLQQQAEGRA